MMGKRVTDRIVDLGKSIYGGGRDMTFQLSPSRDVGLRQTLEGGLAIIRNQGAIDEARRNITLDRLLELFDEAASGSQAIESQNLLFATEQRPAFERFSVLFRYLHAAFGETVSAQLSETKDTLAALRTCSPTEKSNLEKAATVIEKFLSALQRGAAVAPLEPPREFRFG
jgi:hypothetical protein